MTDPDARDPYAPPTSDRPLPSSEASGDGSGSGRRPRMPRLPSRRTPPGGTPPGGTPPRGSPSPDPARSGPKLPQGRRALGFALAGAVLLLPLPPVGCVLLGAGLVTGVRALRAAGRVGGSAPGAVPAVVLGSIGVLVGLGVLAVAVYLLPELRDYRSCMAGANTEVSKEDCRTTFERSYRQRLGALP